MTNNLKMQNMIEEKPIQTILSGIIKKFDFEYKTLEDRMKFIRSIYIFQSGGTRLGYGFSLYSSGVFSSELAEDAREVFNQKSFNSENLEFSKDSEYLLKETYSKFINNIQLRELDICSAFHYFYSRRPEGKNLYLTDLKKIFLEQKRFAYDKSNISEEDVKNALVYSGNLIAQKNWSQK